MRDSGSRQITHRGGEQFHTAVFWGGRSEIKPSEISPKVYAEWHKAPPKFEEAAGLTKAES